MNKLTQKLEQDTNRGHFWNGSNESINSETSNGSNIENGEPGVALASISDSEPSSFDKVKKFFKCHFGSSEPEREPLLPVQTPRQNVRPPRGAYLILDFIWNRILTEENRAFLGTYKFLILIFVIVSVVGMFTITGNLEYLKMYIRNLLCYLINCLARDSSDCYI